MSAYYPASMLDNSLSARAERLYAHMLLHSDYSEHVYRWRKSKTCAALGISEATYRRAVKELLLKRLVSAEERYTERGRQLVTYYHLVKLGFCFGAEDLGAGLSSSGYRVYMELCNRCGKTSWAVSRRSMAEKLELSLRTISRAVKELREKELVTVTPENRLLICGNNGQTYNRFSINTLSKRIRERISLISIFCFLLLTTPLDKNDAPMSKTPNIALKRKKEKTFFLVRVRNKLYYLLERLKLLLDYILSINLW